METPEGQSDLIRTWYQVMLTNPDEYRVVLRFSVMFKEFCNDSSKDVDYDNYLADLRRQSGVDLFLNKASIVHPNPFRMTYEVLTHHGFEKPPHPPPNLCYSRKVMWLIYPGDQSKTERDSFCALISQHHSKNPGTASSSAVSTPQSGPSSVGISLLGSLG